MNYCLYDTVSGKVLGNITCGLLDIGNYVTSGISFIESQDTVSGDASYIDVPNEELIARPTMGVVVGNLAIDADGIDPCNITGIPAGTLAILRGPVEGEQVIDDGTLAVTTDAPGEYMIRLENFPYQVEEFTLVAD